MKQNRQLSIEHKRFLKKTRLRKVLVLACQIGFLVLFLLLWELAARFNWIDAFIFSSPSRIWKQLGALSQTGDLWKHIFVSTKETVLGFLIATVLGTLVAVVLWWSKSLQDIFEPYLVVLNSLPKIALGPIIIIWVGAGEKAIVTMAVLISVNHHYNFHAERFYRNKPRQGASAQNHERLEIPDFHQTGISLQHSDAFVHA